MRNISDALARLAVLRGQKGTFSADPVHADRLLTLTTFGTNPGALRARFYLPPGIRPGAPLVVVLHGCTQNAAGYDHHSGWSELADRAGFALLYPEQRHDNNPNLCFNWFHPEDTRRNHGEALSIRQMIESMILAHDLDRSRVFVTGLSAGGAMASVMLATYPEVFAAGGIIAGLAYGRATTVPEAFSCMHGHGPASDAELWRLLREASDHSGPWPRITIWQGSADHTVAPSNAEDIAAQWRSVHGLDAAATRTERQGTRWRRTWCNGAGEAVIELNTVAAMGHGTPLGNELGTPGPYMLDVGISSTREIAGFWGLVEADDDLSPDVGPDMSEASRATFLPPETRLSGIRGAGASGPQARPVIHGSAHESSVRKIIEDALRSAGLMR
ncbi:PHB depolymerase family esterase [Starkeya koreensis]|uniref:PHB depolymerase family esterase n=1 Tax=Ancylobacter koreensis TaxID=266121 RepID=A0ABT0DMZ3_9HYPH|nr:PHB depolymerase family esterase [Ancylobacter koreensis]MCK0208650.1 PHB depolymerase family esterase [Ancylobacter koreensis]